MPRVSKRKKQEAVQAAPQIKYYRTCIYVRLSRKDGGHGRRDSLSIQKQICMDFAKKHPEMLISNIYEDNGVTGTTFEREAFGQLMNEVRAGKVDCIIVKDFARFGRDALEAVDLIDVIFPSLDVRFISILDDYDSENPACVQDRVSNILKHFMNDYYAREVSAKLVQAHKQSRERGEFWGRKPPYGYKWSQESKKILIPDEDEKKIVQQIFDWYVFEEMSSYDIVKELNASGVWTPQESHELREYGKRKKEEKQLWYADSVRKMLQNPVYIGAAVCGKTRRMLSENIPLYLVPRQEWEIQEEYEKSIQRNIVLKLPNEDVENLCAKAARAGLTVSQLLENFVYDLVHSDRANGSDERMYANQWFDRCSFSFSFSQTFLVYLIEWGEVDTAIEMWEELEDYKDQGELDEYEKQDAAVLTEALEKMFQNYQEDNRDPADSTLESGMEKVMKWDRERKKLLQGIAMEKTKEK